MKTVIFLAVLISTCFIQGLTAQNTPWDIIYCLNGGENKSMGISKLPEPNPIDKPGWNLIFQDEFQSDSLNPGKWNRSTPWDDGIGACMRGFAFNPANTSIENGHAKITNTIDPYLPGCPYSFGEIKTMSVRDSAFKSCYFYAPGYLEARVKLFTKTGQGAACWLWGVGTPENPGTGGPWNEIDIFELNGVNSNIFNGTYHWTYDGVHVSQNHNIYLTDSGQVYDLSANWTTFGLEWDTASIKWYVNNLLVKELDLSKIPPFCIPAAHYSQPLAPFCLRLNSGNNSVGNQSGVPNPADFPQSMLVDYVRIYKKATYKASPIIIPDGQYQVCASAVSPGTSVKIISTRYYPEAIYKWSSPAFEMMEVASSIPQPPGKMLIWIKPNTGSGQSYPVFLETRFPGNYVEHDTAYLYIAPDVPSIPPDDFYTSQVDTLCRFAIQTLAPPYITGSDFSLDDGTTWIPAEMVRDGGNYICRFGEFKPGQLVDFAFREQNDCGYSPVRYSSVIIPAPPVGCKWPTGTDDSLWNRRDHAIPLVMISPAPVSRFMNVKLPPKANPPHNRIFLNIYDIHARKVFTQTLTDQDTKLDLNLLDHGVYFLQIMTAHAIIFKSAFVKN